MKKKNNSLKIVFQKVRCASLLHVNALTISLLVVFSSCKTNNLVQTELYFGLSKKDGQVITDREWDDFSGRYISRLFSDGSTEIKAQGAWFDPALNKRINEPTRQLILLGKLTRKRSEMIDSLRFYYMQLFDQQSVLRVDKAVKNISF